MPYEMKIFDILLNADTPLTPSDVADALALYTLCSKEQWVEYYDAVDGLIDENLVMQYNHRRNYQHCIKPTLKGLWYYHINKGLK